MILESGTAGKIFETIAVSFFVSLLLVPLLTRFAVKVRLVDIPNSAPHKLHTRIIPISGGLTYAITLLITSLTILNRLGNQVHSLLIAALLIFLFGLWDDFHPLSVKMKLIGQFAGAVLLYVLGVRVRVFDTIGLLLSLSPTIIYILNLMTTLLWMVFITNAYNLVDSMDGLMIGLSNIALIFFLLASIDSRQFPLALLCAAMLGTGVVINFFNSSPGFIFLGDSGAQMIGFLLGAIAILYDPSERVQLSTWFMPVLLLAVPIFDSVLVIVSRLSKKQHIYTAGLDHTYHRLTHLGLSSVQAVQLMQLTAIGLEILAFFAISQPPLAANLMFLLIVILGILAIILFESNFAWKNKIFTHDKND